MCTCTCSIIHCTNIGAGGAFKSLALAISNCWIWNIVWYWWPVHLNNIMPTAHSSDGQIYVIAVSFVLPENSVQWISGPGPSQIPQTSFSSGRSRFNNGCNNNSVHLSTYQKKHSPVLSRAQRTFAHYYMWIVDTVLLLVFWCWRSTLEMQFLRELSHSGSHFIPRTSPNSRFYCLTVSHHLLLPPNLWQSHIHCNL